MVCHNLRCVDPTNIDSTPADLSAAPVVSPQVAKAGDTFTLTFTATKTLLDVPLVTLNLDVPVTLACTSPAALSYVCTYPVSGSENGGHGGAVTVDISLTDLAANVSVKHATAYFPIDLTPPVLASATVSPSHVRTGSAIDVFVTSSEALGGPVVLTATPPLADGVGGTVSEFSLTPDPGTLNYRLSHTVTAQDPQGSVTFVATLSDVAGNVAAALPVGGTKIDSVPPAVTSLVVSPTRLNSQGVLTVSFSLDKAAADLVVSVGGFSMTCNASSPYSCTRAMTGNEIAAGTSKAAVVFILATDAAGNQGSASSSVVFDFQPPGVATAAVSYVTTASNPLGTVSAAALGSTVLVTVNADEAIDPGFVPTLTASNGTTVLDFGPATSVTAGGANFSLVVPAGATDGIYTPSLSWQDSAQNKTTTASFSAPSIVLKTSLPALNVDQSQVTYTRSPWGNAASESLGSFSVPAGPYFALAPSDPLANVSMHAAGAFALGGGALQRVRIWDSVSAGSLLGALVPVRDGAGAITGWPRQALTQASVPSVYVSGIDQAGNESPRVKIQNGEWVATANPPPVGTSPHLAQSVTFARAARTPRAQVSGGASAFLASADGNAALAGAEAAWQQVNLPSSMPPLRSAAAMAYDSGRGVTVLFGGSVSGSGLADTWEWDGQTWTNKTPLDNNPPARQSATLAYDSRRGRIVLFGGQLLPSGFLNDLWEWDGTAWVDRTPQSGPLPPVRRSAAAAYDSARGRLVVFSGNIASGQYAQDLWEWDGSVWQNVTPASGALPGGRVRHTMAYDSIRGVTVIFGGISATNLREQDVWEWDGATLKNATPASGNPIGREQHAMAYDPVRGQVVVFGGQETYVSGTTTVNDTWLWNGTSWVGQTPAGSPSARTDALMAFDLVHGVTIMYGTGEQDIWEWDGLAWTQVTPIAAPPAPSARWGAGIAYDSTRHVVVLFGGSGALQDVWEWNGHSWSNKTPASGSQPAGRYYPGMVYDSSTQVTLVFGGANSSNANQNDLWAWNGSMWQQRLPGSSPPARSGMAMSFDSTRHVTVVTGGINGANDVWEWDDTLLTWTNTTPASGTKPPSGLMFPAMVYDASHSQTLLFGGYYNFGSNFSKLTFTWDGSSWAQLTPVTSPPPRYGEGLTYDSDRGRVILFGGEAYELGVYGENAETWEWDGGNWSDRTATHTKPLGRVSPMLAYDPVKKKPLLFGGNTTGSIARADTWELDASTQRQGAVQFTATATDAALPAASAISGLRVRAYCGGTFSPYAATGAALYGWSGGAPASPPGAWQTLLSNSQSVDAAQPYLPVAPSALLDWTAPSASVAQSFYLGADEQLAFQCRPAGVAGLEESQAEVAMDYIEVRLRYTLP